MAGRAEEKLRIRAEEREHCTVVLLDGVLGHTTYAQLRDFMLKCAVEAPRALIVDLSDVTIAVTSALSAFTTVWLRISDWPATPILVATGPRHVELLRHTAIRRYVGVYDDVDQALLNVERPAPRKRAARELPHDPSSPRAARVFVRETCAVWELADLLTNDAVQVASELVQNTVQHTFSEARLRLELRRGRLTVAVGDDSAVTVVLGDPGCPDNFGRGLHVVAQLARTWGCVIDSAAGSKTVWAVL
ncbi:STAS domain-containing protein [Lentzea sp. NPDC058436]|uniref:STAS domain-containing protein n=1 Tax=Lentzea sp. NPDC058436 TaxID=3346499 RepID=UPI00364B2193